MENSDIFDNHREAMQYQTIWDMDQFVDLDDEVMPHPRPVIYYPYYSDHFERMTWLPAYCKSNKLRDVWAAIERAHIKSGDWHQYIEAIWAGAPIAYGNTVKDEDQGTYRVFVGS